MPEYTFIPTEDAPEIAISGSTEDPILAAVYAEVPRLSVKQMQIGDTLPTQYGEVRRTA